MNKHFLIAKHLTNRSLPRHNSNPLNAFGQKYNIETFGQITIDLLKDCHRENGILFLKVIRQMAFFGVPFFKKLKIYSIIETPESCHYLWIPEEQRTDTFNPVLPQSILQHLRNFGLVLKGDLVGLPIETFSFIDDTYPFEKFFTDYGYSIMSYPIFMQKEFGGEVVNVDDSKKDLCFLIQGEEIRLPYRFFDEPIQVEYFQNCPNLVNGLIQEGYRTWGTLPLELDNLLYRIKGCGQITIKKFGDRLKNLPDTGERNCIVPMIETLDDIRKIKYVSFRNRIVILPDKLLNEKLCYEQYPNCKKLVKKLNDKQIIFYRDIPTLIEPFCMQLNGVGEKSLEKFFDGIIHHCRMFYKEGEKFVFPLKFFSWDEYEIHVPELFCYLRIEELLRNRPEMESVVNALLERGYSKITDLPSDLSNLFEVTPFLQELFDSLCELFGFSHLSYNFLRNELIDTIRMATPEHKPLYISERGWDLLLIKYNLIKKGKKGTLEQLGERLGVTRERVRQILTKGVNEWVTAYKPVFNRIRNQLIACGGKLLSLERFFPSQDFGDFSIFLLKELLSGAGISLLDDYWLVTALNSGELNDFITKFENHLITELDAKLFSQEELYQSIDAFIHKEKLDQSTFPYFYDLAIKEVVCSPGSTSHYMLKKLDKNEIALLVLKQFPNGLAIYKEKELLWKKMNNIYPGLFENDRSLLAALVREDDKALLWGWGYYIHVDHVSIDPNALLPIVEWIEERFEQGVIQLSSNAAYSEFKDELEMIGIPNEHALYSCLRLFYQDRFYLPKSPKIYPKGQTENYTNVEMVEQYIRKKGKKGCSYEELYQEFVSVRGWKEFMLQQVVSTHSEDIIRIGHGTFGLMEFYENITNDDLEPLVLFLKSRLQDDMPYVSINLLLKSKQATCLSLGIDSEELLYSLIQKRFERFFDFPRFPHVSLKQTRSEYGISNRQQVEEFLLTQNTSVFREELKHEFIERRGWEQRALDNALNSPKILPLERGTVGEYVHYDVAGWNDEKQELLENWVKKKMDDYRELDVPYGSVERELLITQQLPPLENQISWTPELLKYLLEKCPFIEFIGTKKSIFVPIPNKMGIQNDVDFLEYLLWNEFGGAAKLNEFQQFLAYLDYSYRGEIPKPYQGEQTDELPYYILGDEIISKRL